ncbi:hypothetical protein [Sphingomonas sp. BAUL-RG-20F-R05-02]|uniref:hypothetical protein n=1 Tax=Sphingomonas sp. BAUL-RG-20F-R05-02 TaxID=2914830 RepID=UPI001F5AA94C|nr:hypothetical protein [Sphingomonas sp. BAUL-RG-20F-R05-02]
MMITSESAAVLTIELEEGTAEPLGDGLFVVLQRDETISGKPMQNVVLTLEDLETLRAHEGAVTPVYLEDGRAHWMGDHFLIEQADRTVEGHPVQSVALSANDTEVLRLAA